VSVVDPLVAVVEPPDPGGAPPEFPVLPPARVAPPEPEVVPPVLVALPPARVAPPEPEVVPPALVALPPVPGVFPPVPPPPSAESAAASSLMTGGLLVAAPRHPKSPSTTIGANQTKRSVRGKEHTFMSLSGWLFQQADSDSWQPRAGG